MKVIDLLNKIANGKIPKHIRYNDMIMIYDKKRQNYYDSFGCEIDWKYTIMEYINDEVEILDDVYLKKTKKEDKKIEKLNKHDFLNNHTLEEVDSDLDFLLDKLNEIIDRLNGE